MDFSGRLIGFKVGSGNFFILLVGVYYVGRWGAGEQGRWGAGELKIKRKRK
jgi:hypothetical protein